MAVVFVIKQKKFAAAMGKEKSFGYAAGRETQIDPLILI